MTVAPVCLSIAREAGRCWECDCRYRPGEVVVLNGPLAYHGDCWRTRGSLDMSPYEDEQPVEMDKLLAVIQAEELVAEQQTSGAEP